MNDKEYFHPQSKMEFLSNYHQWYYELIADYLGDRIIDLGCGKGLILNTIHSKKKCSLLIGVDISKNNIEYNLIKNIENAELVCADFNTFDFSILKTKKIDTILLLDVLEHIKNDIHFLEKLFFNMPEHSKLIIKVPNSQFLFNEIDTTSGHYRRYSKAELKSKCSQAGFKNMNLQYMNIVGGLVYLTKKLKKNKNTTFSENYSDKNLKNINKIIPIFQLIDKINFLPFGLSIIGVFEK